VIALFAEVSKVLPIIWFLGFPLYLWWHAIKYYPHRWRLEPGIYFITVSDMFPLKGLGPLRTIPRLHHPNHKALNILNWLHYYVSICAVSYLIAWTVKWNSFVPKYKRVENFMRAKNNLVKDRLVPYQAVKQAKSAAPLLPKRKPEIFYLLKFFW